MPSADKKGTQNMSIKTCQIYTLTAWVGEGYNLGGKLIIQHSINAPHCNQNSGNVRSLVSCILLLSIDWKTLVLVK